MFLKISFVFIRCSVLLVSLLLPVQNVSSSFLFDSFLSSVLFLRMRERCTRAPCSVANGSIRRERKLEVLKNAQSSAAKRSACIHVEQPRSLADTQKKQILE